MTKKAHFKVDTFPAGCYKKLEAIEITTGAKKRATKKCAKRAPPPEAYKKQMPFMPCDIEHPRSKDLDRIKRILNAIPTIPDMVLQDLSHGVKNRHYGAQGMTVEQVPAEEKVVSLFEPHTDIIKKDRRETFYRHKICLTSALSNLISDCLIVDGTPANATLTIEMLDRHDQVYGRYPGKVALDGGFASKDNLKAAKAKKIKKPPFSLSSC